MDAVAEIKRRLNLLEYVGRSVELTRSGHNYKGRCPFHNERTASFYVFPEKANWRCFGSCGEGGDIFSFVQRQQSLDFPSALKQLAQEADVPLTREDPGRRSRRESLSRMVSAAVDFYQGVLRDQDGAAAREYLATKRGLSDDTIAEWKLGWAPDDWRQLRDHLGGRGFDNSDMIAAGLLVEPSGEGGREAYDRFRGRVIIPITDERGVFVGLAGRSLHDEEPKYLNSPQTELFDKGRTLFALEHAEPAIRESGTVIIVEGYMDVIGPWQAGFRNVVATMGTSLTEQHVGSIRRLARRAVLALDPDAAGLAAAERAGDLFLSLASPEAMARSARSVHTMTSGTDLELCVAGLPAGQDPDDLARSDPEAWKTATSQAPSFAAFAIDRLLKDEPLDSLGERRRLIDRVRPVLLAVRDPVERALYVQRVARQMGVREGAVQETLKVRGQPYSRPSKDPDPKRVPTEEETLLAILLQNDSLRPRMQSFPPDLFTESINREVFLRWLREVETDETETEDPVEGQKDWVNQLRIPPLNSAQAREAARTKVGAILRERLIQRQAAVGQEIAEAEKDLGAKEVASISHDAWMGAMPPDEVAPLAEAVIEELELGISIHRPDPPDL